MSIVLGMNAFAATGDGGRRQAEAIAAWRALPGVRLANLQWPDDVYAVDGFETHPVLRADARTVSGREGRRLPVLNEAFDRLAEIATAAGARWFGYANSDIVITPAAIDRVLRDGLEGYAFSRVDYDAQSREDVRIVVPGVDMMVISADWWRAHRHRFRAYLGGETIWDNVYTAILLTHARAVLLNREPLIRHELHPPSDWFNSPYARYLNYLAALDRLYFSRWTEYHRRIIEMRSHGMGDEAAELRMQREVFAWRPTALQRGKQVARALKARALWYTHRRAAR